ncbi:tail assembly chaperone [Streptomyces phage Nesbitt]|uniref:Tail assembly chaperone n=1 Tax=Streptomyces phage Nesbitt TaxID=2108133 RepID=A0A2P1JT03_9CAUD|nr:tail assembly chaperone [Streptomyces phage Nesbitt]
MAAASAKKNDATGTPTPVEFNGETYTVPPADDWDIDVLEAIDDQRITHALKALLGEDQYKTFRTHNRKVTALGDFMNAAQEAVKAGNS